MATEPYGQSGNQDLIQRFLSHCHRKHVPAKSTIIRQGDPSRDLFYVVSGSVTVRIEDEQGNELVLAYLNAGEFFGEIGLFGEDVKRSAVVRAKVASEIAQISYERLKSTPSLFPDLLMIIAGQLAHRLRRMDQKIGDLAFLDVAGRVARTLTELSKEPSAITHPDGMLVRITRLELGDIVGASREMVGRVLVVLEEQGLISVDGKSVVVLGKREFSQPRVRPVLAATAAGR
ncbi:MAG: cAMP-activated global transcriptional regulator CRP [Proteobacteria bacterium]|nr:cAMP-activated global transcriptional regulator CRP [Pseudomonadota bacterium]